MDIFFEVKPSQIHGMGLFCKNFVKKDTIFHINISRPRKSSLNFCNNKYVLDYYITNDCFDYGQCVIGNKITYYKDIWDKLHPSVFEEKCVISDDISMMCNDKIWPVKNEIQYNKRIDIINNLEMLLVLSEGDNKRIEGVAIRVLKDTFKGEECGNTYGYAFWKNN